MCVLSSDYRSSIDSNYNQHQHQLSLSRFYRNKQLNPKRLLYNNWYIGDWFLAQWHALFVRRLSVCPPAHLHFQAPWPISTKLGLKHPCVKENNKNRISGQKRTKNGQNSSKYSETREKLSIRQHTGFSFAWTVSNIHLSTLNW